ncbi:hypothetical protein [uncultured Leifsonia sp.]|uniref:hypothetical protein n=1 Tax=uncultured Leifsonia sp. TaxID=340359 RepID=UPI0025E2D3F4|nr:hypothetical protein [uncultured Leifsonia sp.]
MTEYLHDSQGVWIAFRPDPRARFLFNPEGDWIGWFPWDDDVVVTPGGSYLGTVHGDRLFTDESHPYRGEPGYPGAPGYPGSAPYPGAGAYVSLPDGSQDVAPALLWPRIAS